MKTWYAASLLFKSIHDEQNDQREELWEESIRIFLAESEAEAKSSAELAGKASEIEYEAEGRIVKWRLFQVERVFEINSPTIESGTEVFSRHLRGTEVKSLLTPFEE